MRVDRRHGPEGGHIAVRAGVEKKYASNAGPLKGFVCRCRYDIMSARWMPADKKKSAVFFATVLRGVCDRSIIAALIRRYIQPVFATAPIPAGR